MPPITVLRPDEPEPAAKALELAPRRTLPERPVVGLVANGKPMAKELLAVFAEELGRRAGRELELVWLEKPAASYQINAEEADALAVRSHLVITGLGD